MTNEQVIQVIKEKDINEIIDGLIIKLQDIPIGKENASLYHRYVKSLLEILWYPYLVNPIIEKEINNGRKRIDIVMDNNASKGFFYDMHQITKIFCPYVYIECKNYGKDVANPEIDQLSGRFSGGRGQFGVLLCREIKDKDLFLKRCQDTYKDGRGLVIFLIDEDIIAMFNAIKEDEPQKIWHLLDDKKRQVILS